MRPIDADLFIAKYETLLGSANLRDIIVSAILQEPTLDVVPRSWVKEYALIDSSRRENKEWLNYLGKIKQNL